MRKLEIYMKRFSRTLVLAGLSLATVAMAAQDGIVLRRTLKENDTETYKIDSKASQTINLPNGMGEQEMNIATTSTYKLSTGKLDAAKGTLAITALSTIDKIDADGPMGDALASQKPKPVTTTGTLDARGHMVMDDSKTTMGQLQMGSGSQSSAGGIFVEFPEKAIKVGDTWEVVVPKSPTTSPEDQKLTAKLVGEKKVGDKDVWIISTSGTFKLDIDSSKLAKDKEDASNPMAGQDMHIKGTIDMTGEILVEKSTGKTLRAEAKMKAKNNVEVMGMNIDSTGTTTIVATLQ